MDKQLNTDEQNTLLSDKMAHQTIKVSSETFQQLPIASNLETQNATNNSAFSLPVAPAKRFSFHSSKQNNSSTWSHENLHTKKEDRILAFVFVILVLLLCNIGILCSKAILFKEKEERNFALVNGDRVRNCPEKEYDGNCFEVTDTQNHVIYRTDNDKRILNFFQCSDSAPQTEKDKCIGEYAFSHNSSIVWYHRLYFDQEHNKHSLIVGPESLDNGEVKFPKIRHMLQEPYNWIIGYENIPPDDFPLHQLYVRGKVMVDSCAEM